MAGKRRPIAERIEEQQKKLEQLLQEQNKQVQKANQIKQTQEEKAIVRRAKSVIIDALKDTTISQVEDMIQTLGLEAEYEEKKKEPLESFEIKRQRKKS